jgi:hypothetical protein
MKTQNRFAIYSLILLPFFVSLISTGLLIPIGFPPIFATAPLLLVIPLLIPSEFGWIWMVVILGLINFGIFYALNYPLNKDKNSHKVPRRIPITMFVLNVLNVLYFATSWQNALSYQGMEYLLLMIIANLIFIGAFWFLWGKWKNNATYAQSLTLIVLLQVWLFWYAFPWLGETI